MLSYLRQHRQRHILLQRNYGSILYIQKKKEIKGIISSTSNIKLLKDLILFFTGEINAAATTLSEKEALLLSLKK